MSSNNKNGLYAFDEAKEVSDNEITSCGARKMWILSFYILFFLPIIQKSLTQFSSVLNRNYMKNYEAQFVYIFGETLIVVQDKKQNKHLFPFNRWKWLHLNRKFNLFQFIWKSCAECRKLIPVR